MTRRVADFSRGISVEEDSPPNTSGLPSYAAALEIEKNANNANNNPLGSDYEDHLESMNGGSENGHSELNNGNHVSEEGVDGQSMSTSDRRRLFEAHSEPVNTNGTNGTGTEASKPKLTVADRLKMFQSKASDDSPPVSLAESEPQESSTKAHDSDHVVPVEKKVSEKETSHSAPFVKPERKITPPIVKQAEKEVSQPKPSGKRIDTVFGTPYSINCN